MLPSDTALKRSPQDQPRIRPNGGAEGSELDDIPASNLARTPRGEVPNASNGSHALAGHPMVAHVPIRRGDRLAS